jgi:membrane-associated phospholipid phosphatase
VRRGFRPLKRYLSAERELLVRFAVGILLFLLCTGAFVALAEDVTSGEPIVQFDLATVNAVHAHTSPTLIPVMLVISIAGSQIPALVTAILVPYFAWKRRWYDLALLVWAVGGAQLLNLSIKSLFHRARPSFTDPITSAGGFSFPSGHATGAMVFYGLLAYWLWHDNATRTSRVAVSVGFPVIVVLVGLSRIYLGVHYPSDVIGGYAAGLAWLALTISGMEMFRAWHRRRQAQPKPI